MSRGMFTAATTQGGLLPPEVLERVAAGDPELPGTDRATYHLAEHERLGEAINRSWNRLLGLWTAFKDALEQRPESDLAVGLTRERWLLPLFDELGYGRLVRSQAVEIEGKSFAISHAWYRTPIHLVGARVTIDRRMPGVAGAAAAAPHSLLQEFLNRSDEHLWGLVSNGRVLRLLRDNHSLSRQAFVEFDLEAIMEGELFSDFRLLWLVCHQSRVEAEEPSECWLEVWFQQSREEGIRALDRLRDGVEEAIKALGAGFLKHPDNHRLHEALASGELDTQDYYRELLRLVYRLIFLFVAEDRDALLDPNAPPEAKRRYTLFYSTGRVRELAATRRGTQHADLWRGLRLVMSKLYGGCPELALPALGSFLWSAEALPWTREAELHNAELLRALRALGYLTDGRLRYPVNWRTIGAEELGSIYESLLELHPHLNREGGAFELATAAGHERKTTGSYYTPTSLVEALLDSALEPVLQEAMRADDPEAALMKLKVCDPAVGSGHFLMAAARRIALRLASVRTGDEEASPEAVTEALRYVVGHCLYGVDLNPMAAELCKVSLWMEALEPGKPLSFLDHRIQVGNSLLGATPALLRAGIPDDAFKPIEGDDRKVCSEFRKLNKKERASEQLDAYADMMPWERLGDITAHLAALDALPDDTLADVQSIQQMYEEIVRSAGYERTRLWADAWCAAFVWKKTKEFAYPITEEVFRRIERNPHHLPVWMKDEIVRLREQYQFFHWHLAFPDVFRVPAEPEVMGNDPTGWEGGFDVVLGNPPWEHTELKEKEWFASRAPEIANASGAKRKRMIEALEEADPALYSAFSEDKRTADGVSHVVRNSDRFPLCGRGRINTYAIFAETNRHIVGPDGRVGCIVPSGIATDDTTKFFFQDLMDTGTLASLYDFENREGIFPGVHRSYKFCLLTMTGREARVKDRAAFAFFIHSVSDLNDPERRFTLSAEDIALLNPNTRTCPIFRTRRDAEITRGIYRRVPVLINESQADGNPWGITFKQGLFNMSSDSHLFRTREELEGEGFQLCGNRFVRGGEVWLPLYEAKMMNIFDHRAAHVVLSATAMVRQGQPERISRREHADPTVLPLPRYWVDEGEVRKRLGEYSASALLGFADVTSATNERTMLATLIPIAGVGHTMPLIFPEAGGDQLGLLCGNLDSFVFDYCGRQSLGGLHYTYFILKQLPVGAPPSYDELCLWHKPHTTRRWLLPRVVELTYTAWDLQPFAEDCGYTGPPFCWNDERRFLMRCELDAAFFHLYGIERDDVDYIMETFPIVKRKDEAAHGEYRTKRLILEIYDEMAEAARGGEAYRTRLDPPPADPRVAHAGRGEGGWAA